MVSRRRRAPAGQGRAGAFYHLCGASTSLHYSLPLTAFEITTRPWMGGCKGCAISGCRGEAQATAMQRPNACGTAAGMTSVALLLACSAHPIRYFDCAHGGCQKRTFLRVCFALNLAATPAARTAPTKCRSSVRGQAFGASPVARLPYCAAACRRHGAGMAEWREEARFETLNRAGQASCVWGSKLLLFGGRTASTFFTDCWAYDCTAARTWELLSDKTPAWFAPRRSAAPVAAAGCCCMCQCRL